MITYKFGRTVEAVDEAGELHSHYYVIDANGYGFCFPTAFLEHSHRIFNGKQGADGFHQHHILTARDKVAFNEEMIE